MLRPPDPQSSGSRPEQTPNSRSWAPTVASRSKMAASPRARRAQHRPSASSSARASTSASAHSGEVSAARRRRATSPAQASPWASPDAMACSRASNTESSPAMYCCVIPDRHPATHRPAPARASLTPPGWTRAARRYRLARGVRTLGPAIPASSQMLGETSSYRGAGRCGVPAEAASTAGRPQVSYLWRQSRLPHQRTPVTHGAPVPQVAPPPSHAHRCIWTDPCDDELQRPRLRSVEGSHSRSCGSWLTTPLYVEKRVSKGLAGLGVGLAYRTAILALARSLAPPGNFARTFG